MCFLFFLCVIADLCLFFFSYFSYLHKLLLSLHINVHQHTSKCPHCCLPHAIKHSDSSLRPSVVPVRHVSDFRDVKDNVSPELLRGFLFCFSEVLVSFPSLCPKYLISLRKGRNHFLLLIV